MRDTIERLEHIVFDLYKIEKEDFCSRNREKGRAEAEMG